MASTLDIETNPTPHQTMTSSSVSAGHYTAPPVDRFNDYDVTTCEDDDVTRYTNHVVETRKDSTGSGNDLHVGFSLDLDDVTGDVTADTLDVNENTRGACASSGGSSGCGSSGGAKRFLTAKYKKNKMGVVRRRLEVEDWIDKELKRMYDIPEDSYDETYDAEMDLDEMIDLSDDSERRSYAETQLSTCKKSISEINAFIDELLTKIANLQ